MCKTKEKREITPPLREWPPIRENDMDAADVDGVDEYSDRVPAAERGLAGADDIVQWLALLMNERGVTYDDLSARSGVAVRTIKNWFDSNQKRRKGPTLQKIQACFEALGQSLIPGKAEIIVKDDVYFYPILNFRQERLYKWLEQTARQYGISVSERIEMLDKNDRQAVKRGLTAPRRRDT